MNLEFWNKLDPEWQRLLYLNYLFETKLADTQQRYDFWATPFDNYKKLTGGDFSDIDLTVGVPFERIKKVDIYGTDISDLTTVEHLDLKEFYCGNTPVSQIDALSKNMDLEKLCCYNTSIKDISPLSVLKNLRRLCLSKSDVADISPLRYLRKLEKLAIYKTSVSDLSPLSEHKNLIKLNINHTPVTSLEPLLKLDSLMELHCFKSQVSASQLQKMRLALPSCSIIDDYELQETEYDDFV